MFRVVGEDNTYEDFESFAEAYNLWHRARFGFGRKVRLDYVAKPGDGLPGDDEILTIREG